MLGARLANDAHSLEARRCTLSASDVDVCVLLDPDVTSSLPASRSGSTTWPGPISTSRSSSRFRSPSRSGVLREGKVLFVRDEDRLYEVAVRTRHGPLPAARRCRDVQHDRRTSPGGKRRPSLLLDLPNLMVAADGVARAVQNVPDSIAIYPKSRRPQHRSPGPRPGFR